MKRLGLSLVALAALAMVSADSAEGAVRRVYVSPRSRVVVVNPVRPIYRPRVLITRPVRPVIYSPWNYNSAVIVPHGNHLHVVPTTRAIGVWGSYGW